MFVVEIFEPWSGRWYPFRVFTDELRALCWVSSNLDRKPRFEGVVHYAGYASGLLPRG